jgi:hypothetical protein
MKDQLNGFTLKKSDSKIPQWIIFASLIILILLGCDKCQQDLSWSDVEDWDWTIVDPFREDGQLSIRYNEDSLKWVFVYIDYDADDTTIVGPFGWHWPFPYQQEFFPFDQDDPGDDRWVFEYNCRGCCCVQVFGFVGGKFTLIEEYTVPPLNCDGFAVDTVNNRKYIMASDNDSSTVFALDIVTGDSLYVIKDTLIEDLEIVGGRVIITIQKNDTCFIKVFNNGQLENEIKLPGDLKEAKDDGELRKIVVTEVGADTRSMVIVIEDQGPSFGPVSPSHGNLVDLQLHKINNQTIFVVTTYDPLADATHITLLGQNGQLLRRHDIDGRLHRAVRESGADKKVFLTTDPGGHQGAGVTNFLKINLQNGEVISLSQNSVNGSPDNNSPSLNADGSFDVTTTDANGNVSNPHITEQ